MDLDIDHYSDSDLVRFLGLSAVGYTDVDVDGRCVVIRELLLQSGNVDRRSKAKLFQFLESARARLHRADDGDSAQNTVATTRAPSSLPPQMRGARGAAVEGGMAAGTGATPQQQQGHLLLETPKTVTLFETELAGDQARPFQVLNPSEKRFVTKLVCVDSLFRENYGATSPTNFVHKLDAPVSNVVSMNLSSVELPFYWYTICAANKNNSFSVGVFNLQFNGNAVGDQVFSNLTIPDGNYGSGQIVTLINNLFNASAVGPDGSSVCGLNFLSCQLNQINLKTVLRANDYALDTNVYSSGVTNLQFPFYGGGNLVVNPYYSPEFYFTVDFSSAAQPYLPLYRSLGWTLGFRQARYRVQGDAYTFCSHYENLNYAGATYGSAVSGNVCFPNYLCSESPYGSNVDNYVFVCVDDFQNNYPSDTVSMLNGSHRTLVAKNILGRVTLAQGFNSIVIENNADFIFRRRDYFGPVNIEKLHISVINRYGEYVDTNHTDLSLTLELKVVYS